MTAMETPAVGTSAKKRIDHVSQLLAAIKAHSDSVVSLATLAVEGGYVPGTLKTYVVKNKLAPFVVWQGAGQCQVGNTDSLDLGPLRRALSQKENRYAYEHLGFTELVSSLIERSRTNAGLALELINRPELPNRLDAFLLLFVTAWEQLLKAGKESDNEHHYGFKYGKNTLHQYSENFIDLIVQRWQQEPDLVKHARDATRRRSK